MKKTILYLRTDLGTESLQAGGSVAHTLGVIAGFTNAGYDVIAASSAMFAIMSTLSIKQFVPLPCARLWHAAGFKIACLFSNLLFFFRCARLCDPTQIAYIYQRYSLLNMVGVILSWRYKIPLILEFNGSEVWVDEHWAKKRWLRMRWLVQRIESINLRSATKIVVVSQVLKDQLCAHGVASEKIVVHPNGVDSNYFNPAAVQHDRASMRAALGVEEKIVFGFIGTFSYWHGIEVLAHMIPRIVMRWPQAYFLLIGDGPLREQLEHELFLRGALRQVKFVGTIPQPQARTYLAACDAFLLPTQPNPDGSRFFGSPTKLFEYMSMAKPIIASDIEQIAQIISPALMVGSTMQTIADDQYVGLLVKPDDWQGFVHAAEIILQTHNRQRQRWGNNARAKACARYTWQHHVASVLDALR